MIDASTVKSVYSGKPGRCCCGCSGTHSESPKTITRVVNMLNSLSGQYELETDELHTFYCIDTETKRYIAYLTD